MITFENEQLKLAITDILNLNFQDGGEVFQLQAEKLWPYVEKLMIRRKVKDLYDMKGVTDILKASCYLYNAFIIPESISSFLFLREYTSGTFSMYNIPEETQHKIFQMCECHMGEESPLDFLIPQKGYPDDLFADAVFIYFLAHDKTH